MANVGAEYIIGRRSIFSVITTTTADRGIKFTVENAAVGSDCEDDINARLNNLAAGVEESRQDDKAGESALCCLHCVEVFSHKRFLEEHYREYHAPRRHATGEGNQEKKQERRKFARYLCNICTKHFADSWTLKHHKKTVHLAVREHTCEICSKSFLSNKDLKRHVDGVHFKKRITYPGIKTKRPKKEPGKMSRRRQANQLILNPDSEDNFVCGDESGIDLQQISQDQRTDPLEIETYSKESDSFPNSSISFFEFEGCSLPPKPASPTFPDLESSLSLETSASLTKLEENQLHEETLMDSLGYKDPGLDSSGTSQFIQPFLVTSLVGNGSREAEAPLGGSQHSPLALSGSQHSTLSISGSQHTKLALSGSQHSTLALCGSTLDLSSSRATDRTDVSLAASPPPMAKRLPRKSSTAQTDFNRLNVVERKRCHLEEIVNSIKVQDPATSQFNQFQSLPGSMEPALGMLPGQLEPALGMLPGQLEPALGMLPGQLEPATDILPGEIKPAAEIQKIEPAADIPSGHIETVSHLLNEKIELALDIHLQRSPRVAALLNHKTASVVSHPQSKDGKNKSSMEFSKTNMGFPSSTQGFSTLMIGVGLEAGGQLNQGNESMFNTNGRRAHNLVFQYGKPKDKKVDVSGAKESSGFNLDNIDDGTLEKVGLEVFQLDQLVTNENKMMDNPVFQLENLENLQLVVPELGEPQIVIPETGIRLKISGKPEHTHSSQSQVLTIVPGIEGSQKDCWSVENSADRIYYIQTLSSENTGQTVNLVQSRTQDCVQVLKLPENSVMDVQNPGVDKDGGETSDDIRREYAKEYTGDYTEEYIKENTEVYIKEHTEEYTGDYTEEYIKENTEEYIKENTEEYIKEHTEEYIKEHTEEYTLDLPVVDDGSILYSSNLPRDKSRGNRMLLEILDEKSSQLLLRRAVGCQECGRRFINEQFLHKHREQFHPDNRQQFHPDNRQQFHPDNRQQFHHDNSQEDLGTGFNIDNPHIVLVQDNSNQDSSKMHFSQDNTKMNFQTDNAKYLMELDQDILCANLDSIEVGYEEDNSSMLPIGEDIEIRESNSYLHCDLCDKVVSSKSVLTKHKKSEHHVKLQFGCDKCDKCYSSEQTLRLHQSSIHEGVSSVCCICLKPFVDITRHLRLQHKRKEERKYLCSICSKSFRTNFALQRHHDMVHLKLRPWPCSLCEKSFACKRDVQRHMKFLHYRASGGDRKEWICPICDVSFRKRLLYDKHKLEDHVNCNENEIMQFLSYEIKHRGGCGEEIFNNSELILEKKASITFTSSFKKT